MGAQRDNEADGGGAGRDSERLRQEASELFAEYVARRADGAAIGFEEWVRGHPLHAGELRRLHEHWSTFERELGRLHDPIDLSVPASDPDAGEVVGDFRLIEVLGVGGMGRVWRAEQLSAGREVALKLVLPSRQTERGLSFFEREARAAARVRHPGVVEVYGAGEDDGAHWIAAELVPGGRTLATFLEAARRQERFPPGYFTHVARLFARVADAVHAAHEAGVIHRDLKPRNILLTPDGGPKVTDFGLARITDEEGLSKTGDFAGTYFYMSPEQVTAKRIGIDHRTDVFSLGAVLYEALTLRCPFAGDSGYEVAEKILYEELPDPHALSHDVPRELAWICAKALEKRRGDRFQAMSELRDELQGFSERQPIRTRPATFVRRMRRRLMLRPMRSALVSVSAAALVVCAVLLGLALSSGAQVRRARFEHELTQIQVAAGFGDLAQAEVHLELAQAESPDEPTPHLAMAAAYAEFDRWTEATRELSLAHQKGYEPAPAGGESGEDLLFQALACLGAEGFRGQPRAEALIDRALELEPDLRPALVIKYRLRAGQDDDAGALAAARKARSFFMEGRNPQFVRMLDAFELEHQGDYEGAIALMQDQSAAFPEADGWMAPRFERALGRLYLRAGRYEEARGHLEAALVIEPRDRDSRLGLAQLHLVWAGEADDADVAAAEIARAGELVARAVEWWPEHRSVLSVAARVQVRGVLRPELHPEPAAFDEALASLARALEAARPGSEDAERLRGLAPLLHIRKGHILLDLGRNAEAVASLDAGLALDGEHAFARILLAQALWLLDEFEAALEQLDEALALLDDPVQVEQRGWRPELVPTAHIWVLWAAGRIGRVERCAESLAAVEAELAADVVPATAEIVTCAEFLGAGPVEELRDCARARELLERYDVPAALRADPSLERSCRPVLDAIARACR